MRFDECQQVLLAALWALCDARPPSKSEVRRMLRGTDVPSEAHAAIAVRNAERFAFRVSSELTELSRTVLKHSRYPFYTESDTGLPGHRKVRVQ